MNYLMKKAAYIRGLADGLDLDVETNEGKILTELIDLIDVMAEMLSDTVEAQMDLEDYVDLLDEDLSDLEDEVYDTYEDDDFYFLDDDDDDLFFDDFDDCCGESGCTCEADATEE